MSSDEWKLIYSMASSDWWSSCRLLSARMMHACTARAAHIMQHRSRHNMAVIKTLLHDASHFKGIAFNQLNCQISAQESHRISLKLAAFLCLSVKISALEQQLTCNVVLPRLQIRHNAIKGLNKALQVLWKVAGCKSLQLACVQAFHQLCSLE